MDLNAIEMNTWSVVLSNSLKSILLKSFKNINQYWKHILIEFWLTDIQCGWHINRKTKLNKNNKETKKKPHTFDITHGMGSFDSIKDCLLKYIYMLSKEQRLFKDKIEYFKFVSL